MKRFAITLILQVVIGFGIFSQVNYDSTELTSYANDSKKVYKERKGFAMNIGLGYGYTSLFSDSRHVDQYGISGLNLDLGMGFYTSTHSRILFNIKANIFISEVSGLYDKWLDKMSEDSWEGLGITLISPFLFGFAPWARSHLLFPSVEYTYFLKSEVPSFFFKGGIGLGLCYDRNESVCKVGLGITGGAGYEFVNNFGCHCELMYTGTGQGYLRALTVLLGFDFILH